MTSTQSFHQLHVTSHLVVGVPLYQLFEPPAFLLANTQKEPQARCGLTPAVSEEIDLVAWNILLPELTPKEELCMFREMVGSSLSHGVGNHRLLKEVPLNCWRYHVEGTANITWKVAGSLLVEWNIHNVLRYPQPICAFKGALHSQASSGELPEMSGKQSSIL